MELNPTRTTFFFTELPRSCGDVPSKVSGPYRLDVSRGFREPFEVYCEQQFENGGWLVFQNRFDGGVDFYRSWDEYRHGFGTLDGEFWLGLEKLHQVWGGFCVSILVSTKFVCVFSINWQMRVNHCLSFNRLRTPLPTSWPS